MLGEDNAALLGSILVGWFLIAALSRAELARDARKPFHLIVDEYHYFATQSFPTLQAEARKYSIDTICAQQYRDQLAALNQGSILNVGNLICFRISGKDSAELAACFDNTPPEPELERQSMLYPTSREGIYRTGDKSVGCMLMWRVSRRTHLPICPTTMPKPASLQAVVLLNIPLRHSRHPKQATSTKPPVSGCVPA